MTKRRAKTASSRKLRPVARSSASSNDKGVFFRSDSAVPGWCYIAVLAAVAIVALCLRLYGIEWGLPSPDHPRYSYFPDEAAHLWLSATLSMGDVVPNHFIYGGTLYFSLLNFFIFYSAPFADILGGFNPLADSILLGRYFLVFVAFLTVFLVYATGSILRDRQTGLLAALFLAIIPGHVFWAQYIRPDILAAFLSALILFFAAKILKDSADQRRWYVYAGMAIGCAVATRLPLIVFGVIPVVAHVLKAAQRKSEPWYFSVINKNVLVMVATAIVALLVLSYHTFVYLQTFLDGLRVTWSYESGIFLDAIDRGPRLYQFVIMTIQAVGVPVFLLAVGGLATAAMRRSAADVLALSAFVPYFLTLGLASWVVVRYTIPLTPVLVLAAAWFVGDVLRRVPHAAVGIRVAVIVVIGWTLASTVAYLKVEAGTDIRDVAAEWIQQNVEPNAKIIVTWNYRADNSMNPVIKQPHVRVLYQFKTEKDPEKFLRDPGPRYLVLNEYVYSNMDRLGDRHPMPPYRDFQKALLHSDYRLIKEFKHPYELFGINFAYAFSAYDFAVVNPGIRIYRRS